MPYKVKQIDITSGAQKQEDFLAINPNGRIPAIIDHDNDDFTVFESGAIMVYLAEKTGKLMPSAGNDRSVVLQWLMFQVGGLDPMQGQANVFYRYFPEKIPQAIERYQNETKRLYGVLDNRLSNHEFLAGEFSIADIAHWTWARIHGWAGIWIEDYPNLQRWIDQLEARPALAKGVEVPFEVDYSGKNEQSDLVNQNQNMITR